ncbi:hypothetical protein [Actinomadura chokoriensis]
MITAASSPPPPDRLKAPEASIGDRLDIVLQRRGHLSLGGDR